MARGAARLCRPWLEGRGAAGRCPRGCRLDPPAGPDGGDRARAGPQRAVRHLRHLGGRRRRVARVAPALVPAERRDDAGRREVAITYFGGIRMPPSTRMVSAFM